MSTLSNFCGSCAGLHATTTVAVLKTPKHFCRKRPLKLSVIALSVGFHRRLNSISTPRSYGPLVDCLADEAAADIGLRSLRCATFPWHVPFAEMLIMPKFLLSKCPGLWCGVTISQSMRISRLTHYTTSREPLTSRLKSGIRRMKKVYRSN
jgi:hypothetical protein